MSNYEDIKVGDKIRFSDHKERKRWWKVMDRDDRYIVAITQAPFMPKGDHWYTVVDLTGWANKHYNYAGNGPIRSSLNTLGGGWDIGPNGEGTELIIPALRSNEWEISNRRVLDVRGVEIKA